MKSEEDKERREAITKEIKELGHIPIVFEKWPSRPIPKGASVIDLCRNKVASSDLLFLIVDDDISEAMEEELNAALEFLDSEKIFYYFTKNCKRSSKGDSIWEKAKNGYILKEFTSPTELRKEIKLSIASYMEDALIVKREKEILIDEEIELESEEEEHLEFELNEGDIITITCMGNDNFYAGFFSREEYIKRRGPNTFDFSFGSDSPQFTTKGRITEDDDYYFVIRVGFFTGTTTINVKIKREYYKKIM